MGVAELQYSSHIGPERRKSFYELGGPLGFRCGFLKRIAVNMQGGG